MITQEIIQAMMEAKIMRAFRREPLIDKGWCLACYLVINWRIQELVERTKFEIPNKALAELAQHLYAYVYEDTMPPAQISHVVLNMAEPFIKGEPVRLGPGDYIAIQEYIRAQK